MHSVSILASSALFALVAAVPGYREHKKCSTVATVTHYITAVAPPLGTGASTGFPRCSHAPNATATAEPSEVATSTSAASSTPTLDLGTDTDWQKVCGSDDSKCNWEPTFYTIKTDQEFAATNAQTVQFWVDKAAGVNGTRRDMIGVFKNIPPSVTRCKLNFYKPLTGINYGASQVIQTGELALTVLGLNADGVNAFFGGNIPINIGLVRPLLPGGTSVSAIDLRNNARNAGSVTLSNGVEFACQSAIAIYFQLTYEEEGVVVYDQLNANQRYGQFAVRAGFHLVYQ